MTSFFSGATSILGMVLVLGLWEEAASRMESRSKIVFAYSGASWPLTNVAARQTIRSLENGFLRTFLLRNDTLPRHDDIWHHPGQLFRMLGCTSIFCLLATWHGWRGWRQRLCRCCAEAMIWTSGIITCSSLNIMARLHILSIIIVSFTPLDGTSSLHDRHVRSQTISQSSMSIASACKSIRCELRSNPFS